MKNKILLFTLLVWCGQLIAQDTIRTLIITEVRMDRMDEAYIEVTNVGTTTLNLSKFELGTVSPWTQPYFPAEHYYFMLPKIDLAPGKSYTIAMVSDWTHEQWLKSPDQFNEYITKREWPQKSDMQLHFSESPTSDPTDSVSPNNPTLTLWNGRDCMYIRYHVSPTDSVVIDQVNGIFNEADGTSGDGARDVAGVKDATNTCTLVRKFSVKTGSTDFERARGIDLFDSEWLPIPHLFGGWEPTRAIFWTVGNHGDYNLNDKTLRTKSLKINWTDSILTVPWGARRDDSIMNQFEYQPGLAWHYHYSLIKEDSAYVAARTGDKLTIYACGTDLDMMTFTLQVEPPTSAANIVIPKKVPDRWNNYGAGSAGTSGLCYISDNPGKIDTISRLGFAARVDTLYKYLEKAPKAKWEMEWVDGKERPDLKDGDILKVTAENGDVKRYYIKLFKYRPSHNAYLSSITWPDIPETYKGIFGWIGDTIPNFLRSKNEYKVSIPFEIEGIPALVAKTEHPNAKVVVERARTLKGTVEDRTVTFYITAEDDTSTQVYTVIFEKERDPKNVQTWKGEPFISQLIHWEAWASGWVEIVNPGTQPLDLSNYLVSFVWSTDPATVITWNSAVTDWNNRYQKYIPGTKWVSNDVWAVTPGICVQDLNVNPIVQPGDVFVMTDIRAAWSGTNGSVNWAKRMEELRKNVIDIDFTANPWGETDVTESAARCWQGGTFMLFKILNDSVKNGLKPANDPNDFILIDMFGDGKSPWVIGGKNSDMINSFVRKPEIYKGATGVGESFGTDAESSQWTMTDRAYYAAKKVGWPAEIYMVTDDIGKHFMKAPSIYLSTVTSGIYKVSSGFSLKEKIEGVLTGTSAENFLKDIIKMDPGQMLTLKSKANGSVLAGSSVLNNGDSLIVISADKTNTTKYLLDVNATGLSDNALLTSTKYTITILDDKTKGTITGFEYTTNLKSVISNITVPLGATLTIIDAKNAYVPFKILNFDTVYVEVKVNDQIYFEVLAENGKTKITYQLKPITSDKAFLTSDVYLVDQVNAVIHFVPEGTSVNGLFKNLIPSPGASIKVVDKMGFDRTIGVLAFDDQVIVTTADGATKKTYKLIILSQEPIIIIGVAPVNVTNNPLKLYPNPNAGQFNISGLEKGQQIQVYNILGMLVLDKKAQQDIEQISLTKQHGIYLVVVSYNKQLVGKYKVIVK